MNAHQHANHISILFSFHLPWLMVYLKKHMKETSVMLFGLSWLRSVNFSAGARLLIITQLFQSMLIINTFTCLK